MKLYVDQSITRHYEVEVDEAALMKACEEQGIKRDEGETMFTFLSRVGDTYPGELALTALVGQASPEDTSETWTMEDWETDDDDE